MPQLILWNDTKYATILGRVFGPENIIVNNDDLNLAIKNFSKFDSLIVLCELNWWGSGQQLQGIELVKELHRSHELNIPVLFVSFHSLADIFNAEREILTAIGHDFYQLPAIAQDFETFIAKEFSENGTMRKLSEMELKDIKSFYCSKEGILSHELHYLNAYLNYNVTAENHDNTYNDLQNSLFKIHELFLADATNVLVSFQVAFPKLTKENISEAVSYIVRVGNNLLKIYGEERGPASSGGEVTEQYNWKVLLLDDQINAGHELVQLMKANGINVVCVDNAPDAAAILEKDWATGNSIMVVIADYRLYAKAEGIKRHQKIQGYQFLKNIASSDHLVRLVAFSGLQRKFLLNSFKHYNIRTEVKSKTDYLSSAQTRQFFCDEIIELAKENLEVIEALPSKCAGFDNYLKEAYQEFRMNPDYNKMESNVSFTAKEYVWEILQQISDGEEISIGAIENIKSPLAKTKKDPEAYFKRFQNYLIARRIALWLYASNKKGLAVTIDSRKIAEILTGQKYPTDAYRQILSTNLGLSLDDFPKNITIEERRWLQYEMLLSVFRDIALTDIAFQRIAGHFGDFIRSNKNMSRFIQQNDFMVSQKYKKTDYKISFDISLNPVLKTATDVRVMHLIIEHLTGVNKGE